MMEYAHRIADLHKEYDGQRVIVVDPQTVYNEFTSGNPDPMAFRMFAKMLYHNASHRLKNILLIGPVYADFRNISGLANRPEGMIALQEIPDSLSVHPSPNFDFYGIMTDRIASTTKLGSAPVSVGVGLLPINSAEEGELAVAKIKEYLLEQDFSGLVNESLSISCEGDGNIHDNQAIRMGTLLQSYQNNYFDSEFGHRTIWLESTGNEKGHEQINNALNTGKLFSVYYSHSRRRSNQRIHRGRCSVYQEQGNGFPFPRRLRPMQTGFRRTWCRGPWCDPQREGFRRHYMRNTFSDIKP